MPLEATMRGRGYAGVRGWQRRMRVSTTYAGGDGASIPAIDRRRTLDTGLHNNVGFTTEQRSDINTCRRA